MSTPRGQCGFLPNEGESRSPSRNTLATPEGLSSEEAARRLREHGTNTIERETGTPAWLALARQFSSPLVLLLIGASIISVLLGESTDAIAIASIVVLNGFVGFVQEHRAERTILALRSMTAPRARVLRDGKSVLLPAANIVPGDILLLEAGDVVAADARLLGAHAFSTNESLLTGESAPAEKSSEPARANAPLAERHDSVFMGTSVVAGTAIAQVAATGMKTQFGNIAHLLKSAEETETPLQRQLGHVGRTLLYICLAIVAIVATIGLLRGLPVLEVFLSAVSLAVAAVPEGLPAIVTIALAIGVQRMAGRHALIRRLPAVEALGCATVICTDKTGTLTTGVMSVRELWGKDEQQLLFAAAACCDAELAEKGSPGIGDPTELAILAAASERGISRSEIEKERPRISVEPFDPKRKRMSITRADGCAYLKGAIEVILPDCIAGTQSAMDAHSRMVEQGLRVLAVARGNSAHSKALELLGLIGIADPPRREAMEAVAAARNAGIRTVMITGDHPTTARAIAREFSIIHSDEEADESVHARATPGDKIRIVRLWKARGDVVAMTGDGVNDAPALREAHIGIAMGKTGTEVTREASDMVLTDDNFASIIAAVREGRAIFDNIRRSLVYLLAGNAGELAVMLAAAAIGLPLPLLPLHLLWINIVTDGLPALMLAMEPTRSDVLRRPPRNPKQPMLGRPQWNYILLAGFIQAASTLGVFVWALQTRSLLEARTLAFSALIFGELFRAFAARSTTRTFWELGALSNARLFGVVTLSSLIQIGIHLFPATRTVFKISPLSPSDLALTIGIGLCPVTLLELQKLLRKGLGRAPDARNV